MGPIWETLKQEPVCFYTRASGFLDVRLHTLGPYLPGACGHP